MPELEIAPEILNNYTIIDVNKEKIGTINRVWVDDSGDQPQYFGVKIGYIVHQTHVIPATGVEIDVEHQAVWVPFRTEHVKDGPTFEPDVDLSDNDQRTILDYYRNQDPNRTTPERDLEEHLG